MRVLLCQPDYIRITGKRNYWMDRKIQPDSDIARIQWQEILKLYLELGVKVWFIDPKRDLEDMCFTANAGWYRRGKFVLSNFRYPMRQAERYFHLQWFNDHIATLGIEVVYLPEKVLFEGQGDVVAVGEEAVLVGYGFRTHRQAAREISRLFDLGDTVKSVRLVDPRFYHLDTCCFYIPAANLFLWYPSAFDEKARQLIRSFSCEKLEVTEAEAENFVCNAVFIDSTIIMNEPSERITQELEARGFMIRAVNTSEFKKSGGSVRCLTLFLPEK